MATISTDIKRKVKNAVKNFNAKTLKQGKLKYIAEFRGKYIYLKVQDPNHLSPVSRLEYDGDLNDMQFAIYKWSSESYDPDEIFFPGAENLDGTLNGAMIAGIKAYYS
ncbi:MAG: hypothetical protein U9N85_08625 [Bacteroidota bacterium]|nr:hypothetical protein [Bacteroidota bacterium]